MRMISPLISFFIFVFSTLSAIDCTVASYNCGCLSEYYDFARAACMQQLMQERYLMEPKLMSQNVDMQALALKVRFAKTERERTDAKTEWDRKGYTSLFSSLMNSKHPQHMPWIQKADQIITPHNMRPVVISDPEVCHMLLGEEDGDQNARLHKRYELLAKRIFSHFLKCDIICLQEADYVTHNMLEEHYDVRFSDSVRSKNGIAWDTRRFHLVKELGTIQKGRAFAVELADNETGETMLVASAHLTGCDPYSTKATPDSKKGDRELQTVVHYFAEHAADFKVIGMDSNVTSFHPRLDILKENGYMLDYENFLEPTCASPRLVLNTRIDWIAVQANDETSITNIPLLSIGLNDMHTNMSDHKPIAAKITSGA